MRAMIFVGRIGLVLLSMAASASAGRRCNVDLEPLLSVHFLRDVTRDDTGDGTFTFGDFLVSKGGAVTLMRTDRSGDKLIRTFASGQLEPAQLQALQRALDRASSAGPLINCFIAGFEQPGPGRSTFGGSEYSLYRAVGLPPLRFNVQHSDPDVPVPPCSASVAQLEAVLWDLEAALQQGVRPLQCLPFGSRSS